MWPQAQFLGLSIYEWTLDIGILLALVIFGVCFHNRGVSKKFQIMCYLVAFGAVAFGYFCAVLFQAVYTYMDTGVFDLKNAGATFYGGVIGGATCFLLFYFTIGWAVCKKDVFRNFWTTVDGAICGVVVAHACGRIGCFAAGCCHGMESPHGVFMPGADVAVAPTQIVLPVQLYESAFLFALGAVLLVMFYKKKGNPLALYLIAYGVWRFVIEYMRGDERGEFILPFLSPSQFWSVILVFVGVGLWIGKWLYQRKRKAPDLQQTASQE